jgi:hypothetical protein
VFEQLETFNEEVVNEVQGQEEYVHLKSKDDEFHFMVRHNVCMYVPM